MTDIDNKLDEVFKIAGIDYKNNYIDECYEKYKNILKIIYKDNPYELKYKLLETPSSNLFNIKLEMKLFEDNFPNSNNEPVYNPNEKYPYFNRIAGFVDNNTGNIETDGHKHMHQDVLEHYHKNMSRFMLFDNKHRCLYMSYINKDGLLKGFEYLRKRFNNFYIEYYVLDVVSDDYQEQPLETIVYDEKLRKVNLQDIYEEIKYEFTKKYIVEYFNGEINDR